MCLPSMLLYLITLTLCISTTCSTPIRHANLRTMHLYHTDLELNTTAPQSSSLLVTESYIDSKLNHFDVSDTRTYRQRTYANDQYYKPNGPIYLYIGGEAELLSKCVQAGEIVENAKLYGAMLYGIEHRYYGMSQPFDTLATSNLQYLSSQQALADLAAFITTTKQATAHLQHAPVVVFGGSYPGALSSWARLMYPQFVHASVASSAPVAAKLDFFEYDIATQTALGPTCTSDIQAALESVEQALGSDAGQTKAMFQCSDVADDVNFLYILADAVSYAAQYTSHRAGSRYMLKEFLCDTMANTTSTPLNNYVSFVTTLFERVGSNCIDFSTAEAALMDTSTAPSLNQRQWYYQSCTEFGYFQSAPLTGVSLRSRRVTVDWHLQLCNKVFQTQHMSPAITATNQLYGGSQPTGKNVAYINGLIDPWHTLSVLTKQPCCSTLVPVISKDTSHCADLYSNQPDDPESLKLARQQVTALLARWDVQLREQTEDKRST